MNFSLVTVLFLIYFLCLNLTSCESVYCLGWALGTSKICNDGSIVIPCYACGKWNVFCWNFDKGCRCSRMIRPLMHELYGQGGSLSEAETMEPGTITVVAWAREIKDFTHTMQLLKSHDLNHDKIIDYHEIDLAPSLDTELIARLILVSLPIEDVLYAVLWSLKFSRSSIKNFATWKWAWWV